MDEITHAETVQAVESIQFEADQPMESIQLEEAAQSSGTIQPIISNEAIENVGNLPVKPKRPISPFFRFIKEMRPKVLEEQPNILQKEIVRIISKKWGSADTQTKARLVEEYQKDMQVYKEQRNFYNQQLTTDQKKKIKEMKQKIKAQKELKRQKRRAK